MRIIEQMNKKLIGFGMGSVFILGVMTGIYSFMSKNVQVPEREPDVIGEFQRIKGNTLILKPLEKENFPFQGLSREDIRKKMRMIPHEDREAMRDKMRELLRDEKELGLTENTVVVMNYKKGELINLIPEMRLRVWLKLDGSEEIEFISARTIPSKQD